MTAPGEALDILPWQEAVWWRLQQGRHEGRLPHAILLNGILGLGKRYLAERLAQSLLCEQVSDVGKPCNSCHGCRLFHAGTHPDFQLIGPDQESRSGEIKVDTIRAMSDAEPLTAHESGYKLVIIDPAERMNIAAANSLLKTLEEPVAGTILILITASPQRLPATIRSRCQMFYLPVPREDEVVPWLQNKVEFGDPLLLLRLANGAPLRASALDDSELLRQRDETFVKFLALSDRQADPLATAQAWIKLDLGIVLEWICGWVSDLLRLSTGHAKARLTNPDKLERLRPLAERLQRRPLHELLQQLWRARGLMETNVNPQLLIENLLIRWTRVTDRP